MEMTNLQPLHELNFSHNSRGIAVAVRSQSAANAGLKKLHGQFYTTTNPFHNELFLTWLRTIPAEIKSTPWLEPFAGSNHIVKMIEELDLNPRWACFDLQPGAHNAAPQFRIETRDTLKHFPAGYGIAITNPPYLAKNSATRDGLSFPACDYDDLYKHALGVMLENVGYVAAIIPESFLTTNLFHDRLYGVASLTCRMFQDTECPVCLAMFIPAHTKEVPLDFLCYKGNLKSGTFTQLRQHKVQLTDTCARVDWKFNEQGGSIGLYAIDSHKGPSIRFVPGQEIDDIRIKGSSRSVTKISGIPQGVSSSALIETANDLLSAFRSNTFDVFLTAFKGMRDDGDYRRRLDYAMARMLLNASVDRVRAAHQS